MKLFSIIAALLLSSTAFGGYEFHALYEEEGFVTEKLLPFAVKASPATSFTVESVSVNKPCYAMEDVHRENLIHIYCTEATSTSFTVKVLKDGVLSEVKSPVFEIKKVALISSTPITDDGAMSAGKRKFMNNCNSCHPGTYPIAKGVTRTHLTNAFAGAAMRNGKTTNAMKQYKSFFSNTELDSLVKYINEEL